MIKILLICLSLLLIATGCLLIKKPAVFFSLIGNSPQNKKFLHTFGISYVILGILCIGVSLLDQFFWTLVFLCLMLVCSAILAFKIAKKML